MKQEKTTEKIVFTSSLIHQGKVYNEGEEVPAELINEKSLEPFFKKITITVEVEKTESIVIEKTETDKITKAKKKQK
jgi:hypothetical protein